MTNEQMQQAREEIERKLERHQRLATEADLGGKFEDELSYEYHVGRATAFKQTLLILDFPA